MTVEEGEWNLPGLGIAPLVPGSIKGMVELRQWTQYGICEMG